MYCFFYQIKWKDYDEDLNTWEVVDELENASEALKPFYTIIQTLENIAESSLKADITGLKKKVSFVQICFT